MTNITSDLQIDEAQIALLVNNQPAETVRIGIHELPPPGMDAIEVPKRPWPRQNHAQTTSRRALPRMP